MSGGKVPEAEWLKGDSLGWRGPWGTTYPANLRLYMAPMTQDQWVRTAKDLKTRPPMPWFAGGRALRHLPVPVVFDFSRSFSMLLARSRCERTVPCASVKAARSSGDAWLANTCSLSSTIAWQAICMPM